MSKMFFNLIHTSVLMDSDSVWKLRNGKVPTVKTRLIKALEFNILQAKERGKKKKQKKNYCVE